MSAGSKHSFFEITLQLLLRTSSKPCLLYWQNIRQQKVDPQKFSQFYKRYETVSLVAKAA
jgi:hypothetical protein